MDVELALLGYSERLECLRDHRIALWDVVTSARRTGSLDSNIRSPAFSDLALLMDQLPQLAAVAFNGAKAAQLGAKTALPAHLQVVNLPSSSPANTTARETKQAAWNILGGILKPHNNAL